MHHDLFPVFSILVIVVHELNGSGAAGFIPTSILSSSHNRDITIGTNSPNNKYDENTSSRFRKYRTEHNYEKRSNVEENDDNISNTLFEWERRREQEYRKRPPNSDEDGLSRRNDGTGNNREVRNTNRRPKKTIIDNDARDNALIALDGTPAGTKEEEGSDERQKVTGNPFREPRKTLTMETLSGGPSLIFAMARRMLFWENEDDADADADADADEDEDEDNDGSSRRRTKNSNGKSPVRAAREPTIPRWHPYDGIEDANPSFRMEPPAMNNRGYASTIRRNSRKRGKVSLWRHALRMYDKMKAEELEQQRLINTNQNHPSTATILRTTEHFEAASVACSKLGLWREALGIYHEVVEIENRGNREYVTVTDNLVLSLVGSCVRAAKMRRKLKFSEEDQRLSLDAVRDILQGIERNHGLTLESRHVNPLAAAYQYLGLTVESSDVVGTFLLDKARVASARRNDDNDDNDSDDTVTESGAKDKASYNIMVQSAIMEGNWTTAIDSLRNMTDAGLYPNSRNLNLWSETAMKKESRGGGRRMRSWKKKREQMLVRGTLPPTGRTEISTSQP